MVSVTHSVLVKGPTTEIESIEYTDMYGTPNDDKNETRLMGTAGNDRIFSEGGRDEFDTGDGMDITVHENDGQPDTIYNFSQGNDRMDITAWNVPSYGDLVLSADGSDARVTYQNNRVTLKSFNYLNFTPDDFLL